MIAHAAMNTASVHSRRWLVGGGILLMIVGAVPAVGWLITSSNSIVLLGTVLITAGGIQATRWWRERPHRASLFHLAVAMLQSVVGMALLASRIQSPQSLKLALGSMLVTIGLLRILTVRRTAAGQRRWIALAGLLALVLGTAMVLKWPTPGVWYIGLAVSIELTAQGWLWIAMSLAPESKTILVQFESRTSSRSVRTTREPSMRAELARLIGSFHRSG